MLMDLYMPLVVRVMSDDVQSDAIARLAILHIQRGWS